MIGTNRDENKLFNMRNEEFVVGASLAPYCLSYPNAKSHHQA